MEFNKIKEWIGLDLDTDKHKDLFVNRRKISFVVDYFNETFPPSKRPTGQIRLGSKYFFELRNDERALASLLLHEFGHSTKINLFLVFLGIFAFIFSLLFLFSSYFLPAILFFLLFLLFIWLSEIHADYFCVSKLGYSGLITVFDVIANTPYKINKIIAFLFVLFHPPKSIRIWLMKNFSEPKANASISII